MLSKKIIHLFALLTMFFWLSSATAALPPTGAFSDVFFFGDSLTDVGNKVEPLPIPCLFVNAPVTNNPPGTLWANILSTFYGFPNLLPSKVNGPDGKPGHDYAVSGDATLPVVDDQVRDYLIRGANKRRADPKALYVIWAGSNDLIFETKQAGGQFVPEVLVSRGMFHIKEALHLLAEAGAKNFLVIGVPDLSITPLFSSPFDLTFQLNPLNYGKSPVPNPLLASAPQIKLLSAGWNAALFEPSNNNPGIAPLAYILHNHPHQGIKIFTWNPFPLLDRAAQNPTQFGFPSPVPACQQLTAFGSCAQFTPLKNNQAMWCIPAGSPESPNNYLFFNLIHPTTKTHALIAQQVIANTSLFQLAK